MALKRTDQHRIVYSTGSGRMCPECRQPTDRCRCRGARKAAEPGDGVIRVRREVQGRKGKTVTTIRGLPADAIEEVARLLKKKCGAGGSARDGVVEIQGDHRTVAVAFLEEKGYRVKLAGG